MTRALVTQLVEALEASWNPAIGSLGREEKANAAITAAREYLATEPSGERAELIADLKREAKRIQNGQIDDWDDLSDALSQAADMLEADAQQAYDQQAMELCNVCGWKAIIPGEPCLVCNMNLDAQQAKPTDWKAEQIDVYEIRVTSPEGEAWRLRSADKNDIFNNFIWRWAQSMAGGKA